MENIIGWVIGIPLLLFTAYIILAIPYSTIIKPLYKGIKKTPETFKNTSAARQKQVPGYEKISDRGPHHSSEECISEFDGSRS